MRAKLLAWINARYPLQASWRKQFTEYYVPKNLNVWYCFGVLAIIVLGLQFISGLWLTFFYTPTAQGAFASVEHIMREVNYGWLLRYIHTTGASAFFIIIYLHIFRSILYGSYQQPRELVWVSGMILYLLLLLEAFCGYVLPWGQMSYWAAQVITSAVGAIPLIGDSLARAIRGDLLVSGVTLHRCFALHVIALPLFFIFLVKLHLTSLRHVGSNNPSGSNSVAKIPFHPYYTQKDLFAIAVFLLIFCGILFFMPEMGGYFLEPNNSVPANPLQTPEPIVTPWYVAPFYAMLRAVPNKSWGIGLVLLGSLLWFGLPWIDRQTARPLRQRTAWIKFAAALIVCSFLLLGYWGVSQFSGANVRLGQLFTGAYFSGFVFLAIFSRISREKV